MESSHGSQELCALQSWQRTGRANRIGKHFEAMQRDGRVMHTECQVRVSDIVDVAPIARERAGLSS